jgi:hypothetical protein
MDSQQVALLHSKQVALLDSKKVPLLDSQQVALLFKQGDDHLEQTEYSEGVTVSLCFVLFSRVLGSCYSNFLFFLLLSLDLALLALL